MSNERKEKVRRKLQDLRVVFEYLKNKLVYTP